MMLASLAASGAGSLYNASAQNKAIEANNRAQREQQAIQIRERDAEGVRQRAMEAEQAEAVTRALFEAAPEKIAATAQAEAVDPSNPIIAAAEEYNVPTLAGQVENRDVNETMGATINRALARTKEVLKNSAILTGQGTGFQGAEDALGRMGSEIGTIGSNRRASSGVANYAASAPAAQVTQSTNPLGDLLMLGGQLGAVQYGLNRGVEGGTQPFDIGALFKKPKVAA